MNYRDEVIRNCPNLNSDGLVTKLTLGTLGLSGETGEVTDLIKKHVFHAKPLDRDKLVKELGDVRWYLEYLAMAIGVSMEEVEAANVAKLRARYPNGFSHEAANAPRPEDK